MRLKARDGPIIRAEDRDGPFRRLSQSQVNQVGDELPVKRRYRISQSHVRPWYAQTVA